MPIARSTTSADVSPPDTRSAPELAPPGAPLHIAVAPGVLDGEHVVIRDPEDTDEDYAARQQLLAAVLAAARTA